MTRKPPRIGGYADDKAAQERIAAKFMPDRDPSLPLPTDGESFKAVTDAIFATTRAKRYSWDPPEPDSGDCLDALRFADAVRSTVDYNELQLIAYARSRGATWQQIAEAMGYDNRQAAERRYRTLRRIWPGYQPPAPTVSPSDGANAAQEDEQP